MRIIVLTFSLYAPWIHSLKEKRGETKRLVQRLRNTFNASVAEVAQQDLHQTITIGVAAITANAATGDRFSEQVFRFVAAHTEAEISHMDKQFY